MPESGSAPDLSGYRGRVVALTGASGFLGGALLRQLLAAGADVHAISRQPAPLRSEGERWWQLDLCVPTALDGLLRKVEPDLLFHLAGETSAARDLDLVQPTFMTNTVATVNLLSSVAANAASTRVVVAGSMEEPTGLDDFAGSPYALSKAVAAGYARLFHELYETRAVYLRVFMTYGPGQSAVGKLVPYVTLALLRGEPALLASGKRRLDWIYVDDVAGAFLAAGLAGPEADGQAFDVGSGELTSVRAVAEGIAEILGGGQLSFGARPDRAREKERAADPTSAETMLGWRAATALSDGLRRTVEWYRSAYPSTSLRA